MGRSVNRTTGAPHPRRRAARRKVSLRQAREVAAMKTESSRQGARCSQALLVRALPRLLFQSFLNALVSLPSRGITVEVRFPELVCPFLGIEVKTSIGA